MLATLPRLVVPTAVADLRRRDAVHTAHDVVLVCDNALPHPLDDTGIITALEACYRCLIPGGGLLVSVRDYPAMPRKGKERHAYEGRIRGDTRYTLLQEWEWCGHLYDLSLHIRAHVGTRAEDEMIFRSTYYAVPPSRVAALMRVAAFQDARVLDTAFYQPLLAGTRPR